MWVRLTSIIYAFLSWITLGSHRRRHPANHQSTQTASEKRPQREETPGIASSSITGLQPNATDAAEPDATNIGCPDQLAPSSSADTQYTKQAPFHDPTPGTTESPPQPKASALTESHLQPSPSPLQDPSPPDATEFRPDPDQGNKPPNHRTELYDTTEQMPLQTDDSDHPATKRVETIDPSSAVEQEEQPQDLTQPSNDAVKPMTDDVSEAPLSSPSHSEAPCVSPDSDSLDVHISEPLLGSEKAADAPPRAKSNHRERPQPYRPPATAPHTPQQTPQTDASGQAHAAESKHQTQPADIKLRVLFERGGYCRVTLLPRRPQGLPEKTHVSSQGRHVPLVALEEGWYQDVEPDNLSELLLEGIVWTDPSTGQEWVLSGREVYVLSAAPTHRGFMSTTRLVLGRAQVVVCTTSLQKTVEQVLNESGCSNWTGVTHHQGAPSGWVVLHGLCPTRSIPFSDDRDIVNILRPLPEVRIQLDGGIRLRHNNWLSGHPPSIHVYGDLDKADAILIDGHKAESSDTNSYTAPGWDSDGNHQVSCGAKTASYSLIRSEPNRELWPAHSFGHSRQHAPISICGPVVCCFPSNAPQDLPVTSNVVPVPASNPVLVGRHPGEVFAASPRNDLLGAPCVLSPPFTPIWAIPADPLRCHKPSSRIQLVGDLAEPQGPSPYDANSIQSDSLHKWCAFILDSGRKGLQVGPADPLVESLWRRYKETARQLWKNHRRNI